MVAYLYKPALAAPPYQAVVCSPGSAAEVLPFHELDLLYLESVIRSGRAVLVPISEATYERRFASRSRRWGAPGQPHPLVPRPQPRPRLPRDARRRRRKLAYFGLSLRATRGVILTALETRFAASILLRGGFPVFKPPPEIDLVNFARSFASPPWC
jgi:hypothetical protein